MHSSSSRRFTQVTVAVEPRLYEFMDFVKVSVPLLLLTYTVTCVVAPLVFLFSTS